MRTALTRAFRVLAECLGPSTYRRKQLKHDRVMWPGGSPGMERQARLAAATGSMLEALEQRALMSTYYISPGGSDSNSGTSTTSAWQSIGKVDSVHLNAGDSVLFQGGQTFYGELKFNGDGGSSTSRVTVSSYGGGTATINSGTSTGASVYNTTGITFSNLNFVGSPGDIGSQDGIRIENNSANTIRSGFTVTNCSISGYAQGGIVFGADTATMGLDNVSLTNNSIFSIVMAGIESYAVNAESNTNVYIGHNLIHNIYGNNTSTVTGSGIMLQGLNGATVEYNDVYDNGLVGGNGNVGIWCYSSNAVIFQYNSSYNNQGQHGDDGDAFDFDADTSNSIMQYNYAANNTGSGFMLGQWWNDNTETGDIIRYNVSQNNGRKVNYSGIDVWGKIENAQIYNNTVYTSPASNGQTSAIRISNNETGGLFASNIKIANNIFVSTGGTPLVDFYSAAMGGATGISFTGNDYFSYSGAIKFVWGGATYSSLSSFQSGTGQEKLNGAVVGAYANPDLTNPGNMSPPALGQTIYSFTDYNLLPGTPIINSGVALNSIFGYTVPLTTSSTGKTIPGFDQHLAGSISPAPTSPTSPPATVGGYTFSGLDIGNPNPGSNSNSGNSFTITGGGTGTSRSSDSFRFVYTTLSGNGQIVASIGSLSSTYGASAAGVMVRSSTAANAPAVSLMMDKSSNAYMITRSSAGAAATYTSSADPGYSWIKLTRAGNTITIYLSTNGSTWKLMGTSSVAFGTSVDIGLASTSGNMGLTETAVFNNVSVSATISTGTPPPTTPVPSGTVGSSTLTGLDIGSPNKGSNSNTGSSYTVTGGGMGTSGSSDSFRYVYTTLSGNGQIIANVASLSSTYGNSAAGVMVRSSTAANAPAVSLMLDKSSNAYMITRSSAGAAATYISSANPGYSWIKLTRVGNTITIYLSTNGSTWKLMGISSVAFGTTIDIGLAATSGSMNLTETAQYKNVAISGTIS